MDPGNGTGVPHAAHSDCTMVDCLHSILYFQIAMRRFMSGPLYGISRKLPFYEDIFVDSVSKRRKPSFLSLEAKIYLNDRRFGMEIEGSSRPTVLYSLEKILSHTTCEHGSSCNTPNFTLH